MAVLDDLSAVARMSFAIIFFEAAPCDLPALRVFSSLVDGVLQRTGAGRVQGALPHAMPTVPQLRREAAHRALPLGH